MNIFELKQLIIKVGSFCEALKPGKNTALNIEVTPEGHAVRLSCLPKGRANQNTTVWRCYVVSDRGTILYHETGNTALKACESMLYLLSEKPAAENAF